ncbi:hypothetical protein DFH09DRAFT_1311392 [Mycena vulgaris]|nr:hypothetical protein DFH09DRAFT_1311392 [Mycena vulgaris]
MSANPSNSRVLEHLQYHDMLNAHASSSKMRPTLGMMARANLSPTEARRLAALSKKLIPPPSRPVRRDDFAAASAVTSVPQTTATLAVIWTQDNSSPIYVFLAPAENGWVWLNQGQNKLALGAPGIGIEQSAELEKWLTRPGKAGEWAEVSWETRMRCKPEEALLFRLKGVKKLEAWKSTTKHLLV